MLVGLRKLLWDTYPQLIATLFGTLIAVSDGISYGWTSPMIPYLTGPTSHIEMSETEANLLETIYLCGAVAGLPVTIFFVDRIGRKKSILFSAALDFISWWLIWFAGDKWMIYIARFLEGLAGDMCYVAAPMYIAEIADNKIRGFLSSFIYIMTLVGVLLVYTLGAYTTYYVPPILGVAITSIQLIGFMLMPETPYYYVFKDREEDAKNAIRRLKRHPQVENDIKGIKESVERQKSDRGRPQDLVLVRSNRMALLIMTFLNFAQHMSGISAVLMNLHTILDEGASIYLDSSQAAIIFAVLMLVSSIAASMVVDKFGRKVLLFWSSLFSSIFLGVLTVYFHVKHLGYDVTNVSWVPCVFIMSYGVVFKFGLGLVPIVITSEIFPTSIKAIGMTLADVIYVAASIVSIQFYQLLESNYGMYAPFYMFTACAVLTTVLVKIFVPETKGKTLDEIQVMLKGVKS